MNNSIFDFKKKIAFTAALVFVAHSFGTLPASAASSAVGTMNTDTVGLTDNENDAEENEVGNDDEDTGPCFLM